MKLIKSFLIKYTYVLFLGWVAITSNSLKAQTNCENMGFELGNFSGWEYSSGCNPSTINFLPDHAARQTPCYEDINIKGICCTLGGDTAKIMNTSVKDSLARHSLHFTEKDTFGGFSVSPPKLDHFIDSKYSLRLGNAVEHGEADRIERHLFIDSSNAIIAYEYAFLLNDPGNHHKEDELPYFEVNVFNSVTDDTIPCGYAKYISNGNFDSLEIGKDPYDTTHNMIVRYQEWKAVYLDLTDYIGQNITLQFTNSDCAKGGHWGYTYLASGCKPFDWGDTTICANGTATLKSPFPENGFELEWSTGETTEEISVSPNTTTTYTLSIKNKSDIPNSDSCRNQFELTVHVLNGEDLSINDTSICKGNSVTLSPNPSGINCQWFTTLNGTTPFHEGSTFTTAPLYNDTVFYIEAPYICTNQSRIPVKIDIIDYDLNAGEDKTICKGDSVVLNGSGSAKFYWTPSETLNDSSLLKPIAFPSKTTTYTLQTYSTSQCMVNDEVTVVVENIDVSIQAENVCLGNSTNFISNITGSYQSISTYWDFGDGNISNTPISKHTYLNPGEYIVKLNAVTEACSSIDTASLEVYPIPTAEFTASTWETDVDNPEINFTDLSIGATSGEWNMGDNTILPYQEGDSFTHYFFATNQAIGPFIYDVTLTLTNEFNCRDEITHPVKIKNYWSFYAPNSFTPNGDGVNDVFKIYGIGILDYTLAIYDRWGELLHTSSDINTGWNGDTKKNYTNDKKQDVYVWKVNILNNRGIWEEHIGHVSLLK